MDTNTKINNLRTNLVNLINQSDLPVGIIYYLLKDLVADAYNSYKQTLVIEQQVACLTKEDDNIDSHQE